MTKKKTYREELEDKTIRQLLVEIGLQQEYQSSKLTSIKNNIQFIAWVFIVSLLLYIVFIFTS